jgi:hypothetical protein
MARCQTSECGLSRDDAHTARQPKTTNCAKSRTKTRTETRTRTRLELKSTAERRGFEPPPHSKDVSDCDALLKGPPNLLYALLGSTDPQFSKELIDRPKT